jgi:hypothetical protein
MQRGPAREALNIALSHFLAHLAAANKTSISPRQQASFLHMPLTVPSPAQIMTVSIFCGYRLVRSGRASSGSTARAAISNSPCCRDAISAPSSIAIVNRRRTTAGTIADENGALHAIINASSSYKLHDAGESLHHQDARSCLLHRIQSYLQTTRHGCRLQMRGYESPNGQGRSGHG